MLGKVLCFILVFQIFIFRSWFVEGANTEPVEKHSFNVTYHIVPSDHSLIQVLNHKDLMRQ